MQPCFVLPRVDVDVDARCDKLSVVCWCWQNIHLVARWLPTLEKKIEQYSVDSHPAYRVYMSAEPASSRESHTIPQGILEVSIKITNEPPTGMMANLHKALDNFNQVYSVATGSRLCRNEWTNQSGG